MVGEGVLLECLSHPSVDAVLSVSRKPCGITHSKLTEYILGDFLEFPDAQIEFMQYDTCLFCLGVSSVGLDAGAYYTITYELTLRVARTLSAANPGMVFCYISGSGTDSTERGRIRWARVKGKTENALLQLPFRGAYMFRPGLIKPSRRQRHILPMYSWFGWLYPVVKAMFPNSASTMQELARAMIHVARHGYEKTVLEVRDILRIAKDGIS